MELKKKYRTALFALPIITTFCLNSLIHAAEDPSAVTLDAMIISSEQSPEAFESI